MASAEDSPTILLLYGWASYVDDWMYQIRHFQSKGCGLVVPGMMGYGGSSCPSKSGEYRVEPLSRDWARQAGVLYNSYMYVRDF